MGTDADAEPSSHRIGDSAGSLREGSTGRWSVGDLDTRQRLALTAGSDQWHTPAIAEHGVPALRMTDGPVGARGTSFSGPTSACFPCGTALAATFDAGLVREIGAALGQEARAKRAHVLLAPTVNLHRTPLGGRSFECLSEDPIHTAHLAVAYIEGVQAQGVVACVKHFAGNETEYRRMTISSDIDERTLREMYLVPFEAAVRRAGVRSVMTAYNRLNGTYCSEHPWLVTTVLRGDWGFDGLVVSDWYGTHSGLPSLLAGLDVEMPGPALARAGLLDELAGDAAHEALERAAGNVLATLTWAGAAETGTEELPTPDGPELRGLLREAAEAAFVLLRNEATAGSSEPVLPLTADGLRIAVVGPNGPRLRIQGGGSAGVVPPAESDLVEELKRRGHDVVVEPGVNIDKFLPTVSGEFWVTLPSGAVHSLGELAFRGEELEPGDALAGLRDSGDAESAEVTAEGTFVAEESGICELGARAVGSLRVLIDGVEALSVHLPERGGSFYGRGSHETRTMFDAVAGQTYHLEVRYTPRRRDISRFTVGARAPEPGDLFERAVAAAAEADVALVLVGTNNDWETEGEDRSTLALPGRQDELISAIAAANPCTIVVVNTGSAVTMDWLEEVPAAMQVWFAGQEMGAALAGVLVGEAEPTGRLPLTLPRRLADTPAADTYPGDGANMAYDEGLAIGYRWYRQQAIEPLFWFGHGLSYGQPSVVVDRVEGAVADGVRVRATVTNTGERAGTEVVQVYVASSTPDGPLLRFAGATKVTVEPGARASVIVDVDPWVFRRWSGGSWSVQAGPHTLHVGTSAGRLTPAATLPV